MSCMPFILQNARFLSHTLQNTYKEYTKYRLDTAYAIFFFKFFYSDMTVVRLYEQLRLVFYDRFEQPAKRFPRGVGFMCFPQFFLVFFEDTASPSFLSQHAQQFVDMRP